LLIKLLKICLFAFILTLPFQGKTYADPNSIMAIVNDDVVTSAEFNTRMDMVIKTSNIPNKKEVIARVAPQVLNILIEEKLQTQEAKRLDISVTNDEIYDGLARIAQQNNLSIEDFQAMLKKRNIDPQTLADQVTAEIAWGKIVSQRIRPLVDVTERDVDARIAQIKASEGRQEFLVAEIFLPVTSDAEDAEVAALANNLITQLKQGKAPFPVLAQQFSQSAGANRGGVVGWIQEGQIDPAIEAALKSMKAEELSTPIRAKDGYHIIALKEKRIIGKDTDTSNINVLKVEVTNELGQNMLEMRARRYMRELKSQAFIERRV